MDELKPCPFCGGKAFLDLKSKSHGEHFGATFEVGCRNCCFSFKKDSRWYIANGQIMTDKDGYKECIEAWNRRADQ